MNAAASVFPMLDCTDAASVWARVGGDMSRYWAFQKTTKQRARLQITGNCCVRTLLSAGDVITAFTGEIMTRISTDHRCQKFADDVADHYIDESCDFPLAIWSQSPDLNPTTTNGAESLHIHNYEYRFTCAASDYVHFCSNSAKTANRNLRISIGSLAFT